MPKEPKTRDELFVDALQSTADDGSGVGGGGAGGSGLAKRQRKQAATNAKIEAEIRNEISALGAIASGPKPIAPPPGPAPPPTARGARGKPVSEDKIKAQCVAIRVALARYKDLVESHPHRYGDIEFPELKDKMGLDELKGILKEVEGLIRARAGTFAFKSFFTTLPQKLEEASLTGMIPLNLIGLPQAIYGEEVPDVPEFSASEEYRFLIEELAVKYDALFAVSPEIRFLALFAGAIASVHNRNQSALEAYLAKNRTNNQPPSSDV